ncbi:hypothetical protein OOZ15_10380 [Galbibacter sp. EGI 63066]|uniref:hypothetical protein n=1 Tax=Galbibacter sp. EGI 63066 TaxID=2993559 RepID=UPI002248B949|nr:hypothetical protein [Galbibacter sp. EGI 63066]MCX2680347.1 hypothetical protein [Galbibacter sp. EGI 63066]
MALLKKVKASTLMETMVATVLIVVVFMVSSLILNNLFTNFANNNTRDVQTYIDQTEYKIVKKGIKMPYYEEFKDWDIEADKLLVSGDSILVIRAVNTKSEKQILKQSIIE